MVNSKSSVREKKKRVKKGIKMYKEIIITILVLGLIIIGNILTQNNTIKAVETISNNLNLLKEEIEVENVNKEDAKQKMDEVEEIWKKEYEIMAYYIEHNELEKVETEISKFKADIEMEEYSMAVESISSCDFILEHIKDKNALKIVNIF